MADITILNGVYKPTNIRGAPSIYSLFWLGLGKNTTMSCPLGHIGGSSNALFDCAVYDTSGITCTHEHLPSGKLT